MAVFEVLRHTSLEPDEAWRRITDWERHGEHIPFTTVALTGTIRDGVGAGFVARTSIGPVHIDDPMEVTHWDPPVFEKPGRCEIEKRGRVILGGATITVHRTSEGSVVRWVEDASVRWGGPFADLPTQLVGPKVFGRVVDQLLAEPPTR